MLLISRITDWKEIKSIYQKGIETSNATFETVEDLKDYKHWLSSKIEDSCFVYQIENQVIGWSALSTVSSRCVYSGVAEVSVYVDPESKGKGVGSHLLNALIDYSEKKKI